MDTSKQMPHQNYIKMRALTKIAVFFKPCNLLGGTGGGGGGGFLARTIRLLTVILKRLNLAHLNLVTFTFYLLGAFWENFRKIHSPEELPQLFFK